MYRSCSCEASVRNNPDCPNITHGSPTLASITVRLTRIDLMRGLTDDTMGLLQPLTVFSGLIWLCEERCLVDFATDECV